MSLIRSVAQLQRWREDRRRREFRKAMQHMQRRAIKRAQDTSARFVGIVPGQGGALLWKLPPKHFAWPSRWYLDQGRGWRKLNDRTGAYYEELIHEEGYTELAADRSARLRFAVLVTVGALLGLGSVYGFLALS